MVIEENVYHVVRKGESLGVIARKHKTTIAQIKKWNKLRSDKIRAGQRLKIVKTTRKRVPKAEEPETKDEQNIDPTAVPDAVLLDNANKPDTTKVTPLPKPKPVTPKQDDIVTYKVKNGDTLWAIAKKHKVTPEDIMKWNKCGENIRPGQVLKIQLR
jgi:membrane-bound lytic murein transglycosylase D